MKVSAQYAQEHFDDLLAAADSGEEVEIARPDQSAFRLTLVRPAPRSRRTLFGAWEGLGIVLPTEEEWRAMDKEIEDEMLNGPIFPADQV